MPSAYLIWIGFGLFVLLVVTMLWAMISITQVVKTNMTGITKAVYDVDAKLQDILEQTTGAIKNLNSISAKINGQMDQVEVIMDNVEVISQDVRITTRTVQTTIVPIFVSVMSVLRGVRAGLDAWRGLPPGDPREGSEDD